MKRCVAPAHLLLALLLAAGLVSGADRVVETRRGEAGWDGPSCDRYGNWRSVPDTVTIRATKSHSSAQNDTGLWFAPGATAHACRLARVSTGA